MFLLADEDLDRRAETEDREPPLTASEIRSAAEERLLADTDEFTNWLVGHCANVSHEHTRLGYIPRGDRLGDMLDTFDVPQLVACLLHPNRDLVAGAASRLRDRYEAENGALLARFVDEVQ